MYTQENSLGKWITTTFGVQKYHATMLLAWLVVQAERKQESKQELVENISRHISSRSKLPLTLMQHSR